MRPAYGAVPLRNQYPSGIALTAAGRVNAASLVRHHFPLREAEDALQFADEHRGESLKVVVDIGDTDEGRSRGAPPRHPAL